MPLHTPKASATRSISPSVILRHGVLPEVAKVAVGQALVVGANTKVEVDGAKAKMNMKADGERVKVKVKVKVKVDGADGEDGVDGAAGSLQAMVMVDGGTGGTTSPAVVNTQHLQNLNMVASIITSIITTSTLVEVTKVVAAVVHPAGQVNPAMAHRRAMAVENHQATHQDMVVEHHQASQDTAAANHQDTQDMAAASLPATQATVAANLQDIQDTPSLLQDILTSLHHITLLTHHQSQPTLSFLIHHPTKQRLQATPVIPPSHSLAMEVGLGVMDGEAITAVGKSFDFLRWRWDGVQG